MHLILTGATGLVGAGVLHNMLNVPAITKVTILSRRPVPMAEGHPKAHVVIHKDFTNYPPELLSQLQGAEGCVWALGVSANDVSKEDYVKITLDYPLAAAKVFSTLHDPFKFVYVSGEGATTTPGTFTPYFAVVKGRAEAALLQLGKDDSRLKPYSVRPGGVDASAHSEIREYIPARSGFLAKASAALISTLNTLAPSLMSPTRELGKVLTELAMGDGKPLEGPGVEAEGRTVSNKAQRRLAEL